MIPQTSKQLIHNYVICIRDFPFSLILFHLKIVGVLPYDLSSTVTSPCGITEDAEINEIEDGLYAVHFVPKELGVHTVSVRYKEVHIPGKCELRLP